MSKPRRPFVRETAALPRRRHAVRADDKAELHAVVAVMRDIPREYLASREDIIHFIHKQAGRIRVVADNLEPVEVKPIKRDVRAEVLSRSCQAPPPKPGRDQEREITSAKGRLVRVVERSRSQLEMAL